MVQSLRARLSLSDFRKEAGRLHLDRLCLCRGLRRWWGEEALGALRRSGNPTLGLAGRVTLGRASTAARGAVGARCAVRASQIVCEELGLERDLVPELARDFLQSRWEDRRGIRRAGTCEMEAVTQAITHLSAQSERALPGRSS